MTETQDIKARDLSSFTSSSVPISGYMNALSRREEEALLKVTKAQALKECDPIVKGGNECSAGS